MYKSVAFAAALSFAGSAAASPHLLGERAVANPACARDNLLRCFLDARYDAQVSAYCNDLPTFTTTVATVTATSYETEYSTITASTQTDTVRTTTTVFTNTVPASTQTVTRPVPQLKRDVAAAPPPCATNYPASRITSACSCISVAAPTESVTYTISTETITTTLPSLVTATVTESTTETVLAEKTQGVKVVEVDYPVHVYNGDFEKSPARGWSWTVSNAAQLNARSAWIGASATQAWILPFVYATGVSGRLTNQLPLKLVPGKRYRATFGSTINSGDIGTAISLNLQAPSAGQFFHMKSLGGTPYRNYWYKFESYFTYPANWPVQETTLYMNINPVVYNGGYTIYLDDINVEEVA